MSQADPALWGLACMLAWGVADMLGRYASVRVGGPSVALAIQGLGIVPALLGTLLVGSPWSVLANAGYVTLAVLASLLFSVAYLAFYRGLERGLVSIVSPLSAGSVVVTTLLSVVFFHETIGPLRWLLICVILAGIVVTSSNGRGGASVAGVGYGLTAMMAIGVAFAMWKPMVEDVGPFLAVVSVRVISSVFLGVYLRAGANPLTPFRTGTWMLVTGAAVLDSLGFIVFNLGIELNPVSLVIPIAAAYPVVTVGLAWVLLKERVARMQIAGISTVMAGVVAFSAVT